MYKIVCFTQIYNEITKGNLERFIKYVIPKFDDIVVYDDCSTDGSYELLSKHTKNIIRGGRNDFKNELFHKQQLLELALTLKPDFIFWVDIDEVLSNICDLQRMCQDMVDKDMDGMRIRICNLWRSQTWERVGMFTSHMVRFWRVRPGMKFDCVEGLHNRLYPSNITKRKIMTVKRWRIIHYGFCDDMQLAYKFFNYRKHGQKGYFLYRILLEKMDPQIKKLLQIDEYYLENLKDKPDEYYGMEMEKLYLKQFPPGLYVKGQEKPEARDFKTVFNDISKYFDQVTKPGKSYVCHVPEGSSQDKIMYFYQTFLRATVLHDAEFMFLLTNNEHVEFLKFNRIPYTKNIRSVKGYYLFIMELSDVDTLCPEWDAYMLKNINVDDNTATVLDNIELVRKHEFFVNPDLEYFCLDPLDTVLSPKPLLNPTQNNFLICNDYLTGRHGEKVMWQKLLSISPNCKGIDMDSVKPRKRTLLESKSNQFIKQHYPEASVILQNASFLGRIEAPKCYKIVLLQDDLVGMNYKQHRIDEQAVNLKDADLIVANSFKTASSYPDYHCEVISLGLNTDLFKPLDKKAMRDKHGIPDTQVGIFVGAFIDIKGWHEVKRQVEKHQDIFWILVTKHHNENYSSPNSRVFRQIDQTLLVELLNCANFFILGSPVETQCLAALEAGLCDIPIIMHNTGIFADFTQEEKNQIGIITDDFDSAVININNKHYEPRSLIIDKGLDDKGMLDKWYKLLSKIQLEIDHKKLENF